MTSFLLPLRNDLDVYEYRIDLAEETFTLRFAWNRREERYHFSVYDEDGALLAKTPLVLNNDLIGRFRGRVPTLPQGTLYAIRESGSLEEPARADYGDDFKLFFDTRIL